MPSTESRTHIKTTISVCSVCLNKVPAVVYEEAGEVLLEKTCPEHGLERALLSKNSDFYYRAKKSGGGGGCGPW